MLRSQRMYPSPQNTVGEAGSRTICTMSEKKKLVCDKLKDTCHIVFYKMVVHGILELEVKTKDHCNSHVASRKCLSMLPRIPLSFLCDFLGIGEITAPKISSMIFQVGDENKPISKPHG